MAANMFLKLDGIKGQSEVEPYKEQIEILSYSQGVSMNLTVNPSNQTRTTGRPTHSDINFSKMLDVATCDLLQHCNAGTNIKTAEFTITQADGATKKVIEVWHIAMTNAIVSSVNIMCGSNDIPSESFSLNYDTITWTFKPQSSATAKKGKAGSSWDLTKNEPAAGGKG
jgi:type VI secretion system secreted protein Hcp